LVKQKKEAFAALLETHADEFVLTLPGGPLARSVVGRKKLKTMLRKRMMEVGFFL
jgi:hypothetical protein